ncbi:MAG: aspartate aminotransferase family protein [Ignavibacteriaceae bacterium]
MQKSALLKNYNRYPIEFEKGNGFYLYDTSGKEYIDFYCGIAVTSFGHNHPKLKAAAMEQIDKLWHTSNLFSSSLQESLANKLSEKSGMGYVFFSNSGTEANEAAIKFARKWGNGKSHIISTLGSFHGRSFGSLSATGQYKFWNGFQPLLPGFSHVPYGSLSAVANAITPETVAVIVETIQGEGGVNEPPENYLKGLRKLCSEKNILLIIDEIQTGIGRTGKFYSYQHEEIIPDIVTSAKGLANGIPLGATLCSEEVAAVIKPGDHGSTFGGNPVAVAVANKVVDLLDKNVLEDIFSLGNILMNGLHGLHHPSIKYIRGKGLIIGVEFSDNVPAKKVASQMLDEGFVVGTAGDFVLRILPPFIITQNEIAKFLLTLKKIISDISEAKLN